MKIRKEDPVDASAIEAVTIAAFQSAAYSSHTEQFIVRALRESGQLTVSLVAEDNGSVIGHVAVSPVTISSGATKWYGLGPISVVPKHQGQGIGAQLIERALMELQALGAAGCVVLGEPSYYSRFGFNASLRWYCPTCRQSTSRPFRSTVQYLSARLRTMTHLQPSSDDAFNCAVCRSIVPAWYGLLMTFNYIPMQRRFLYLVAVMTGPVTRFCTGLCPTDPARC